MDKTPVRIHPVDTRKVEVSFTSTDGVTYGGDYTAIIYLPVVRLTVP